MLKRYTKNTSRFVQETFPWTADVLQSFRQYVFHGKTKQKVIFSLVVMAIFSTVLLISREQKQQLSQAEFRRSVLGAWDYTSDKNEAGLVARLRTENNAVAVEVERENSKLNFTLPVNNPSMEVTENTARYRSEDGQLEVLYELESNKLKESIILNSPTDQYDFISNLVMENLKVKTNEENLPVFFDIYGKYQFHLEKPFAIDAAGNRTDDVTYTFRPKTATLGENPFQKSDRPTGNLLNLKLKDIEVNTNEFDLVVIVDPNWLNDPARVYPITIDPTVTHDTSAEFATGTLNRLKDTGSGASPNLITYYRELPADENTAGLWHMNEGTDNTCSGGQDVCDASGNSYNGTFSGNAAFNGSGIIGSNSVVFDGTGDYISMGDIDITGQMTVEAWINPSTVSGGHDAIYSKETWGFYNYDGTLKVYVGGNILTTSAVLSTNTWQHVATTLNETTDTVIIYLNGNEIGRANWTGTLPTGSANTYIGRYSAVDQEYFQGVIDEVRISNITRTPEEIRLAASRRPYSVYTSPVIDLSNPVTSWTSFTWTELGVATGNGETLSSATNLFAQWNFNETSGTTADNAEGTSALDGTLTSFASTSSQDQAAGTGWTANNRRWGAGALMFDGTNDEVRLADDSFDSLGTSGTIEGWVNLNPDFSDQHTLFSYGDSAGTNYYASFFVDTTFTLSARVRLASSSFQWTCTTNEILSPGLWYHLAWTHSPSEVKIYINGKEATTNCTETGVTKESTYFDDLSSNSELATIGARRNTSQEDQLNGVIDSIRIYSRALTASEILSNYNASNIEFQTRVGDTADPNDGSWEAWAPTTSETAVESFDSSQGWTTDNGLSTIEIEGTSLGDGADGALAPSGTFNFNSSTSGARSYADGIAYRVNAPSRGQNYVTRYSGSDTISNGIAAGDEVLLINLQGSSSDYADVGNYEVKEVLSVAASTITFTSPVQRSYTGTSAANQKVVIQRVPNYSSVTLDSSDSLTATAWDALATTPSGAAGYRTGIVAFKSTGTVTVGSGTTVTANSLGYRGGVGANCTTGTQGESYLGTGSATYTANGGGGGSQQYPTNSWGGGGGGNYGGSATAGTRSGGTGNVGAAGGTYGISNLSRLFYGSGGGAGTEHCGPATNGGIGGGIIFIQAATISNSGTISANGQNGVNDNFAGGGGGSGGSILFSGDSITTGTTTSSGGTGGTGGPGGNGGSGRVYIEYETSLSGTTTPTAVSQKLDTAIKQEGSDSLKFTLGKPVVDANTVALWHLDETNGDNAGLDIFDATTNNNDGEFNGSNVATSVLDGINNKSRDFNGTDDYISVIDSSSLDIGSGDFTVETWIKADSGSASTDRTILSKGTVNSTGYKLSLENGGYIFFRALNQNISNQSVTYADWVASPAQEVDDGKWHHIVAKEDGTYLRIFLDGQEVAYRNTGDPGDKSTATALGIGRYEQGASQYFSGIIDEVRISNAARTAEEIAEAYRMGRDHFLNKTISSTDLSSKKSLPFWIAANRPGTYLEAAIGEGAYPNLQTDANTVAYWKMDEGIADSCNSGNDDVCDLSGNNIGGDFGGHAKFIPGKIGKGVEFDGTTDYVSIANNTALNLTTFTLEAWTIFDSYSARNTIIDLGGANNTPRFGTETTSGLLKLYKTNVTTICTSTTAPPTGVWVHVAVTYDGSTCNMYINGKLDVTTSSSQTFSYTSATRYIGYEPAVPEDMDGKIDEVRISNSVRSAAEIRQMYETGLRTHPVTIDFGAKLDSGNLIADSADTGFTVDATYYGLSSKGSNIYPGDKIIVRETVNDTEYIAQGTVTAVTLSTGAVTVDEWDSGSTFPSGGYTANASVFKWQREYFNISNLTLSSFMDGITRLTLRVTDGNEGRTVWLDDLKSAGDFLTTPGGSSITSSTGSQYFQYRAIFSSRDPFVSSSLTTVQLQSTTTSPDPTPSADDPSGCYLVQDRNDSAITLHWSDNVTAEVGYEIQKNTDDAGFAHLAITSPDATSFSDTGVETNHTYQYQVRAMTDDDTETNWCTTSTANLGTGSFQFEGLQLEGLRID